MSRTFTVQLNDNSEHIPRAARRVIFNSDFLKAAKLCTGDVVALSSAENSEKKVGIKFPDLASLHYYTHGTPLTRPF